MSQTGSVCVRQEVCVCVRQEVCESDRKCVCVCQTGSVCVCQTGSAHTDLLMLDAVDDGLLAILLAAAEAEDAGNLEDLRGEEGP